MNIERVLRLHFERETIRALRAGGMTDLDLLAVAIESNAQRAKTRAAQVAASSDTEVRAVLKDQS